MKTYNDFLALERWCEKADRILGKKLMKWAASPSKDKLPTYESFFTPETWELAMTRRAKINIWCEDWEARKEWSDVEITDIPSPTWKWIQNFFCDALRECNVLRIITKRESYIMRYLRGERKEECWLTIEKDYKAAPAYLFTIGENGSVWNSETDGDDEIDFLLQDIIAIESL